MIQLAVTRLKYFRKKALLSEAQLAELIGVPPFDIVMFEAGKKEPDMSQYIALSYALGVSIDELVVYDDNAKTF